MPPAIIAVGGAALAASAAYTGGIVIFGATIMSAGIGAAVVAGVGVLALSAASGTFSKPKRQGGVDPVSISAASQDRTISVTEPVGVRGRYYGQVRLAGKRTFMHVTGSNNEYLHMVQTLSGHRFQRMTAFYLDDELVPLDSSGNATGKYAGYVKAIFGDGSTAGDAAFMAALKADCPDKWTDDHRQTGCAKLYLRFKYSADKFPGSLPNPSGIFDAACEIGDPRISGSPTYFGFTDNLALGIRDYLLLPKLQSGRGEDVSAINDDSFIAAANACDEIVDRLPVTARIVAWPDTDTLHPFVSTDTGDWNDEAYLYQYTDVLGSSEGGAGTGWWGNGGVGNFVPSNAWPRGYDHYLSTGKAEGRTPGWLPKNGLALRLGSRVQFSGNDLPSPLASGTDYYWIPLNSGAGRVATSLTNARAGVYINITDQGDIDSLDITVDGEPRYTMNGGFNTDQDPLGILNDMISAGEADLVFIGDQWHLFVGVWRAADTEFGLDDLAGGITVRSLRSRRDLATGIKGTFYNPDTLFQPSDIPVVSVAAYVEEDGDDDNYDERNRPYTNSPSMAQRLNRIALERLRRQVSTDWPLNLTGLQTHAGATAALTNANWGWDGKTFTVRDYSLKARELPGRLSGGGGDSIPVPVFGVDATFEEVDASVFAWDPTTDESILLPAPKTKLPDPFFIAAPGAPVAEEDIYITRAGDGVKAKVTLTSQASASAFVAAYQFEYQLVLAGDVWTVLPQQASPVCDIFDIAPGIYNFRSKAISQRGVSSGYSNTQNKEIHGLLPPPAALSGLTVSAIGGLAVLRWTQSVDLDVRIGGRIEFRHTEATIGAVWTESTSIGEAVPGSETVALLPLKAGTYLARAYDSGNTAGPVTVAVTKQATALDYADAGLVDEAPGFTGGKTGVVLTEGVLKLASAGLIDDVPDIDALSSIDALGGLRSSGEYDFANGFDFGAVRRRRLTAFITALVVNANTLIDSRSGMIDSWADFDGTSAGSADAQVWFRTSDDASAGSPSSPIWGAWNRLDSAEVVCRSVQFQLRLLSSDAAYNIHISALSVKAEEVS